MSMIAPALKVLKRFKEDPTRCSHGGGFLNGYPLMRTILGFEPSHTPVIFVDRHQADSAPQAMDVHSTGQSLRAVHI